MREKEIKLTVSDGKNLQLYLWLPPLSMDPVGMVQVAHGLGEHGGRYRKFARFMSTKGFIVCANDHRGHGKTVEQDHDQGLFAVKDGWERVIEDLREITRFLKKEYPSLPCFLLGHSMGSLMSRHYISESGEEISGVILSGTSGSSLLFNTVGKWLINKELRKTGPISRSSELDSMLFGGYNRSFKPNRTKFDWLCRDESVVDEYITDSCCGFIPRTGLFSDLQMGFSNLFSKDSLGGIPKNLPVFFISGTRDPVSRFAKGSRQVFRSYKKKGIEDVTFKLYPGARHEVLNEINRNEVYEDIYTWIQGHMERN
ncbi:MAG: lysophospholipase [Spirochaetales bacterium]|nr:lysophospholipase [Spirochaetales bacterium]